MILFDEKVHLKYMHILYRYYPFCKVKYIVHIHKLMALNEKWHRDLKIPKNAMLNNHQEMRQLQMIAYHFIKKWSSSDESQEPNLLRSENDMIVLGTC